MKLKNLVFVFFAVMLSATCVPDVIAQSASKLHLVGTIKGIPDGTEINLVPSSTQGLVIPGSKVSKGSFTIESALPQPDMFIIVAGAAADATAKRFQLFMDNEIVEVDIDANTNSVNVSSGPSTIAFSELMQTFGPEFDKLSNISRQRQQAGNSGYYSDSLSGAWEGQSNRIAQMITPFIQKHGNTSVSAFLLNTVWPLYNNVKQMDAWLAMITPAARGSVFGKNLDNQMSAERMFGFGQMAPDFVQNDTEGKPVSLKEYRGKYVLVDFWASWCGPCRQENPNVVQAFQRFKSKNFTVLGVSLDRDKSKWLQAIKDDNLSWGHVSDLKFWQNEVAQMYKVSSIPQNFLLDPEGRIIGKNLRGDALDDFLEKTLGSH